MEDPGLVAMIPVDREMALEKRWNMPFQPLLDRLESTAAGCSGWTKTSPRPPRGHVRHRLGWLRFRVKETKLYVDYRVTD